MVNFIRNDFHLPVTFVNYLPLSLKCGMPLPSCSYCIFESCFAATQIVDLVERVGALNPKD